MRKDVTSMVPPPASATTMWLPICVESDEISRSQKRVENHRTYRQGRGSQSSIDTPMEASFSFGDKLYSFLGVGSVPYKAGDDSSLSHPIKLVLSPPIRMSKHSSVNVLYSSEGSTRHSRQNVLSCRNKLGPKFSAFNKSALYIVPDACLHIT